MGITETQRKRRSRIQLPIVTESETGKNERSNPRGCDHTQHLVLIVIPDASHQTRRRTYEPSVNQGIRVSPLKSNGQVIAPGGPEER